MKNLPSVSFLLQRSQRVLADNAPTILTAVGVAGTLTTAYLTGKATIKATRILIEDEYDRQTIIRNGGDVPELSTMDYYRKVWKLYLPPAICVTFTCKAIVMAQKVNSRRLAAFAAAYVVQQDKFNEYKDKVTDSFGKTKEQKIRDDIARDQVKRNPPISENVIRTGFGKVLCHEAYTGRYFEGSMEAIRKAENDINAQILSGDGSATISDFYNYLKLPHTTVCDEFGWNTDNRLEIAFSSVICEDEPYMGIPCISFDYLPSPVRRPWQFS